MFEKFFPGISNPLDFPPEISGIFGRMIRITRKLNNRSIFRQLSMVISLLFALVSTIPKFWLNGKHSPFQSGGKGDGDVDK